MSSDQMETLAPNPRGARKKRRTLPGVIAVLLSLAILEHWLLVLPLPDEALWSWALGSRKPRAAADAGKCERSGMMVEPSPLTS